MSVNSPVPADTNFLETGIRPLAEVDAPVRYDFGRTVAAPAAVETADSTADQIAAIVDTHGEASLETIGAQFQQAMQSDAEVKAVMDELCTAKFGMSLDVYAAKLGSVAEQSATGQREAAIGTQFDGGKNGQTVAFMGLGPTELVIIGIIAVLLFGKRLPEIGRSLGKGIVEFKRGITGEVDEIKRHIDEAGQGDNGDEDKTGDGTEVEDEEEDGH